MTEEFKKQLEAMLQEDLVKELDEADERDANGEELPMSDEMKTIVGQDEQMSDIYERLAAEDGKGKREKVCADGVCAEFVPKGEKREDDDDEIEDTWSPPNRVY